MTTLALRMPAPEAVVTRPDSETPAAVVCRNWMPQPQIEPTTTSGSSSCPPSSRTHSFHVPLAFARKKFPLSVCNPVPPTALPGSLYGAGGAGGAKLETGVSQFVGSKLPVVSGPLFGSTCPAVSMNVSVTPGVAIGIGPPASPIRMNFCPCGPSSSTSMLSGNWCVTSNSVMRSPPICCGPPETVIVDGYGTAGAPIVMSMHVVFRKSFAVSLIVKTAVDGVPNVAPVGPLSVRLTVSFASTTESGHVTTLNVFDVSPGAKVSVPEAF